MPILNNIPRKNGRHNTTGDSKSFDPSRLQHVPLGFEGLNYSSPFTDDAVTNVNHHNNATIAQTAPLQVESPGVVVALPEFVKVHPYTKTILTGLKPPTPTVKRVMGPSPTSNTPFHPKPHVFRPRRPRISDITTEQYHAAAAVVLSQRAKNTVPTPGGASLAVVGSFHNGNHQILSAYSNQDQAASRWQTVKRGAAG